MECLRFLPIANKLTAPKLDEIAAVQAATIFFLPILLYSPSCWKRSHYVSGNVTWQVSDLSPQVGSGQYSGIWYGPDLSETWSQCMSGRVTSGRVGSGLVRVRIVEFGLYSAPKLHNELLRTRRALMSVPLLILPTRPAGLLVHVAYPYDYH